MNIKTSIIFVALVASKVTAFDYGWHKYTSNEMAWDACSLLITATGTFCGPTETIEECFCENIPALGTISHCYVDHFDNSSTKINYFLKRCSSKADFVLTPTEFFTAYDNATDYLIDPSQESGFNQTQLSQSPFIISQDKVDLYYTANYNLWINYNKGIYYGIAMLGYWFVVMIVAAIWNWSFYVFPSLNNSTNGPIFKMLRRYLLLPTTGRKNHLAHNRWFIFEWLSPTRVETVIVMAWVILVIVLQAIGYSHIINDPTDPSSQGSSIASLIATRTGIGSVFIFPLIILFAGRNNFMQWVTGWSYSRMLVFHRWTSRVSVSLVLIHGAGMTANAFSSNTIKYLGMLRFYQMGVIAFLCGVLMCIQSLLFFRKRCYEVFVLLHILLALVFLIAGWKHTVGGGYQYWWYPAFGFWGIDRLARIARLIHFGTPLAKLQLNADETLKVTVKRPASWKPFPGSHAFIYFFRPTCFWQSHPFTIMDSVTEQNTITFYIKVKGGTTHGLYQYLLTQPNNAAEIRVSVEGPYGIRAPIDKFENAVLLAGGNGIPGLYSHALDLASRESGRQVVKLYWIIAHWNSLACFYQELLKLQNSKVEIVIYITRANSAISMALNSCNLNLKSDKVVTDEYATSEKLSDDEQIKALKAQLSFIEFREERPNIKELVESEIRNACGSTAFAACAHPAMVDDIRSEVVNNISKSKYNVNFFEEMQVW